MATKFLILFCMVLASLSVEAKPPVRKLNYSEKMFLDGFKTGCFLGQIKVLPFEGIPAFSEANFDFCEAAYWEIHDNFDKFQGKHNEQSRKK